MPIRNNTSNTNNNVEQKVNNTDVTLPSSGKFHGRAVKRKPETPSEISKLMKNAKPVETNNNLVRTLDSTLLKYAEELSEIVHGLNDIQKKWDECDINKLKKIRENVDSFRLTIKEQLKLNKGDQKNICQDKPDSLVVQSETQQVDLNDNPEEVFLKKISLWESKGSKKEQRGEAATRIKQAFAIKSTKVDISSLKLSEFPEAVFDIPSLVKLNCNNNLFRYLPERFDRLPNLEFFGCKYSLLSKIPESLMSHPQKKLYCELNNELQWIGLRENYLKRDNILIQTYRKRHLNDDGSVSFEQGPLNLSPKAMQERKFWVYNEESQSVYRGATKSPQEVIKEGGFHTKALSTEGIVYHVNALAYPGCKLTGGAISTSKSLKVAQNFVGNGKGYVYKINLTPQQGVDVCQTIRSLEDSGTINDKYGISELKSASLISDDEDEISVIHSITPSQISVMDEATKTFIPINEWVDPKTDV